MRDTSPRYIALVLLSLAVFPASAQVEEADFTLLRWYGGTIEADLQLGFNLTGVGIGNGTLGGVSSPRVSSGAASLFSNPAELGLMRQHQITLGSRLGLGMSAFGLNGASLLPPSEIAASTDNFLEDFSFATGTAPVYTEASGIRAGQVGRLSSFSLALPVHRRFVMAVGMHYPLDLSLGLNASGLEALFDGEQQVGDQAVGINVQMNLDAVLDLSMRINTFSFGMGGLLYEGRFGGLTAGVAFNRYQVNHALRAGINPDASVVLGGIQQYAFNDPDDPNLDAGETNAFYWRAQGNFSDAAWGVRAGLVYAIPWHGWNLSLAYNGTPTFHLSDDQAYAEGYLPSFINTEASGGADEPRDLLMVDAINLAKPTLTQATGDSLGQVLTFRMPSSITAGLDVALGPHTVAFNYIHYLDGFSYRGVYGKPDEDLADNTFALGKDLTSGIRLGVDLKFPDRLGGGAWALIPVRLLFLDLDGLLFQALGKYTGYKNPHYRFGGGVGFGPAVLEGRLAGQDGGLSTALGSPLPGGISLGRQYTVFDDLDIGMMVFSVPDLLFRVSLAYNFSSAIF